MNYKPPFYAVSKAVHSALSVANNPVAISFYDSSVPINEIETSFANQAEFAYGIYGTQSADCTPNEDAVIWTISMGIEIYSNYKGRKVIAQKLEALLNYFSGDTAWNGMQAIFRTEGYNLVTISVGTLTVNMPMYGDTGVWQNGQTELRFQLYQIQQ